MKKKMVIIVSLVVALCCIGAIVASAVDAAVPQVQKVDVVKDKTYYAYYNTGSMKGAVAFCLDNKFVGYGTSTEGLQLCTKREDGVYTSKAVISKESMSIWFYGKTEHTVDTGETVSSLLGGLSGIGITLESDKTNVAFELNGTPVTAGTTYYVYIPQDFFIDDMGNGNAAAYVEIEAQKVNSYTGNLIEDLKTATADLYDVMLFGIESVGGILS